MILETDKFMRQLPLFENGTVYTVEGNSGDAGPRQNGPASVTVFIKGLLKIGQRLYTGIDRIG